ncbi:hypothetical protein FNF29_00488 [Cafeteria roenbergensis]|uniref:Uncharacterized protein n=1 Tax=Cafeteria roenbergensis TaxID=33653 RepID=A0A5A8CVR3_CAFRO|nr:hypothetical protein FNF29_00488 [Cafeteria roenbergensis]|eukprot:KAA0157136.1 hypothetical protein FNF29_00488 [Cafeteria roenbergensis]
MTKARAAPREEGLEPAKLLLAVVLAALSVVMYIGRVPGHDHLPVRETPFEYHYMNGLFSEETLAKLDSLIEEQKSFKTAVADQTAEVDNIGEALPIDHPGCGHPLMTPDLNFSRCMLPSRVDIARHFLSTGGPGSFQERYESSVPRLMSFIAYLFKELDSPAIRSLFDDPQYVAKATDVCRGRSVFDPIQLNLIVMVPGQELPMHFDVPWLWGATRFALPQWLLVVMEQSQLWADRSVPQIQGVSWLHDSKEEGGEFFFYPDGPGGDAVAVPSRRNSAIVLDGCRAIHGVRRFKPGHSVPPMDHKEPNELRRTASGEWDLVANGETLRSYNTSDFRISLVWRARCFTDEAEKARWATQEANELKLPAVLDKLDADLRKRGVLAPNQPRPEPLDFATMLLSTYVPYPNDPITVGILGRNLCMAPRILPAWLRPAGQAVVDLLCQ